MSMALNAHILTKFINSMILVLKTREASPNCSGSSSITEHSTMITGTMLSRSLGDDNHQAGEEWTTRIGNDRHLMCIKDPFETGHDLGRVVDRQTIRILREEFERAAAVLQYDHEPCVTLFEPYTL